jgi:uncharacterized membrane protein
MNGDQERGFDLERRLATVLQLGTGLGSCIIATGWVIFAIGEPLSLRGVALSIIRAGIAVFILLPALRVLVMIIVFFRERDYRFGAIAALVLTVIVIGAVLGVRMAGAVPG